MPNSSYHVQGAVYVVSGLKNITFDSSKEAVEAARDLCSRVYQIRPKNPKVKYLFHDWNAVLKRQKRTH